MKFAMVMVLVFSTSMAFAKEVKDFNKALIQDVQKDLKTDNDQSMKANNAPMRGPASVDTMESADQTAQENSKIEKKEKQLGNSKW